MRLRQLKCLCLALMCAIPGLSAAHTISLSPASTNVSAGNTFNVDLIVSDLDATAPGNIVSAIDVDVVFNAGILKATQVAFASASGLDISGFDLGTPGLADLFAFSTLSDADLLTAQGGGPVKIATITFLGLAEGIADLSIDTTNQVLAGGLVNDVAEEFTALTAGSSVTVGPRTQVPAPATAMLLGLSIAMGGWLGARPAQRGRS